jgi:hypothetical protein
MKSLYNISQEAINLASLLEEGELNENIENQLSINQKELQEKAINYGYVIKAVEDDVSIIDIEIKRLQDIKKAKQSVVDRLKESVLNAMNIYGIEKVTSPTLNLSIRKSKSTEIIFEAVIDEKFKKEKVTVSIDKTAIKKAIESGETVEGAILKENQNLQIK